MTRGSDAIRGSARWRSHELVRTIQRVTGPSPPRLTGMSSPATGAFTSAESDFACTSSELPMRCASPWARNAISPDLSSTTSPPAVLTTHCPSMTTWARAIEALAGMDTHQGARAVASSVTPAENRASLRTSESASMRTQC